MPKATSSAPPTTPEAPPVVPATSAPLHLSHLSPYPLQSLRPMSYIATLSTTQIQQHLGILPPPEHDMPGIEPTAPSEEATPAEQAIPSGGYSSRADYAS
ncbi:hypothetical protein CK203_112314 [Vitis vinifera]|uniref:Uncharacterized protein n=1 Tax=Vitis vinifera TaxID=29760 RepID=A0A438C571_VITVI|nr:hypothetical protein CK203_112314 [Vitis vinifera]